MIRQWRQDIATAEGRQVARAADWKHCRLSQFLLGAPVQESKLLLLPRPLAVYIQQSLFPGVDSFRSSPKIFFCG